MTGTNQGSLAGIRVVDLTRIVAGPLCTQMLADHGAEVVKVEPPDGDETRRWGPPYVRPGTSAYFTGINRNKTNVCLDLRTPQGQEVLDALLTDADVLVENFKPGTLAKWGLGDEVIAERYPRLVYCRITGFGVDGPMGGAPGYDAVLQAYSGLMSVTGESGGAPLRAGVPIVDMMTATLALSGVLLALVERARSGRGQVVDCSLLDTAITLLHPHSPTWLESGTLPTRIGSAHPSIAPYDSFEARDGLLFVGAATDRQFRHLCEVLGLPELCTDARFVHNLDRVRNIGALRPLLAEAIAEHDKRELGRLLLDQAVPASPVHDIGEALTDPQVLHRDMVIEQPGYRGVGIPIKLDRTPGTVRTHPQDQGANTRRVLETLGYTEEQIDGLIRADIARSSEPAPAPALELSPARQTRQ